MIAQSLIRTVKQTLAKHNPSFICGDSRFGRLLHFQFPSRNILFGDIFITDHFSSGVLPCDSNGSELQ